MPQPNLTSTNLGLTITNPLVLYRALLSTNKIRPDPAQHRLALQLQQLYFRLKDYEPEIEYRYRLERAARLSRRHGFASQNSTSQSESDDLLASEKHKAIFDDGPANISPFSRLFTRTTADGLSVTRTIPIHDSAMTINSPQGMLLYGEVGRGKSMLLDLLYDSLPTRKKRRWHFNTFMLDIFRRLEMARIERSLDPGSGSAGFGMSDHEHVILSLARETMETSPILFLDEFQLPDRVAGKLVNGFLMAFFHLGGVLVASSNRMPEELAKAQGVEFASMGRNSGKGGGMWGRMMGGRLSEGQKAARGDFGVFVEVLKKRCEVWEMEGERDWRRDDGYNDKGLTEEERELEREMLEKIEATADNSTAQGPSPTTGLTSTAPDMSLELPTSLSADTPPHYHVSETSSTPTLPASYTLDLKILNPSQTWIPTSLTVYARTLHLPMTSPENGIALLPFSSICATNLGPADYISICSAFHTLVVTSVPVLTLLHKNEARRFITLLDACYEARCRLLIEAAAPPDRLFFPETRTKSGAAGSALGDGSSDSIDSEAFSEMYQDSTAPFRPNITSYTSSSSSDLPTSPRSVLADEDADFGPTYGNGRSHGRSPSGFDELEKRQGPDFTQTGALTGEDERFAYKRARSRLWEMCGRKWWDDRSASLEASEWWRPVDTSGRFWEKSTVGLASGLVDRDVVEEVKRRNSSVDGSHDGAARRIDRDVSAGLDRKGVDAVFRHGASPFRTSPDPPPKFGWQHAWGMMQWGKKAGEWGKGVDGDRRKSGESDSVENEGDSGSERGGRKDEKSRS